MVYDSDMLIQINTIHKNLCALTATFISKFHRSKPSWAMGAERVLIDKLVETRDAFKDKKVFGFAYCERCTAWTNEVVHMPKEGGYVCHSCRNPIRANLADDMFKVLEDVREMLVEMCVSGKNKQVGPLCDQIETVLKKARKA